MFQLFFKKVGKHLVLLGEILLRTLRVGFDRGFVLLFIPIGWADLAVLINKLESLDESESFIN